VTDTLTRLARIARADRIDDVWAEAADHFAGLGFRRVNYGLTRFRTERSIGDPEDALFLTTSDPDYARLYVRDEFFKRTPVYRWLLHNEGLTTWRWVQEDYAAGRLPPEEAEAVRINARYGIVAGIAIGFPATQRTKGALGLTADPGLTHDGVDAILARDRPAIEAVAHMMHLRLISLPARYVRRRLTPRQREVLEWVADGKSAQDIGTLMRISAAMVEKHLRLARAALNVETTAQAVAKGTLLNLIFSRGPAAPDARAAVPLRDDDAVRYP
jgi:LuxR family transcriptional regulator